MKNIIVFSLLFFIASACYTHFSTANTPHDIKGANGVITKRDFYTQDHKIHFFINNESKITVKRLNMFSHDLQNGYQTIMKTFENSNYNPSHKITIYLKGNNNVSYATKDTIVLYNTYSNNYELIHELTHALLGIGNPNLKDFNNEYGYFTQEGMAVYLQEKIDPTKSVFPNYKVDVNKIAKYLLEKNKLIPLGNLTNSITSIQYFGNDDYKHKLLFWRSYIEAGSFTKFLINNYSLQQVKEIYNSKNLDQDINTVFHKSIDDLESEWENHLRTKVKTMTPKEKDRIILFLE